MISRSRRRRDGWFSGLRRFRKASPEFSSYYSEQEMALALEKERCRSERRDLSFCIIQFDFSLNNFNGKQRKSARAQLAEEFRKRLRITDEIGIVRGAFSVLLPETVPLQAAKVANELASIAKEQAGIAVLTDIYVWPEVGDDVPPPNESGYNGAYNIRLDSEHHSEHSDTVNESRTDFSIGKPGKNGRHALSVARTPVDVHPQPRSIAVRRLNTSAPTPIWKRSLDLIGASLGLVLLWPLFLATAAAIRLTSNGPAFFTQWREGKDGQLFKIYKFRTMRVGADEEKSIFRKLSEQDGPAFKLRNDPRLTPLGRILRKSCVDELPQLLNVLKGEMSLVGPRPLPVDESLNCSPWQRRRLDVTPGITCFWQVQGARTIPFDQWMRMDLNYVKRRSIGTDLILILKTIKVTVLHRGSV